MPDLLPRKHSFVEASAAHHLLMVRWLGIVSVVMFLLLAGCTGGSTGSSGTSQGVAVDAQADPVEKLSGTVSMWGSWDEDEMESLFEVIAAFQKRYPDVSVEISRIRKAEDDLLETYLAAAANRQGPSILSGPARWGPVLFDAGLVVDPTDWVGPELLTSLNSAALDSVSYRGAVVGLPHHMEGGILFRNRSLLPEPAVTWDELVANVRNAKAGGWHGAWLDYGLNFSAAHLQACGGDLMTPEGDPAFNTAAGICWLQLLDSFKEVGKLAFNSSEDLDAFESGQAGYFIGETENMDRLIRALGAENLAVDPWPVVGEAGEENYLSGYITTENLYINTADGAQIEAVAAFVTFILSPEAQTLLANPEGAAHVPVLKSISVTDPFIQQQVAAFERSTALPVVPEMEAYWNPLNTMLYSVIQEDATPESALGKAFEEVQIEIMRLREAGE